MIRRRKDRLQKLVSGLYVPKPLCFSGGYPNNCCCEENPISPLDCSECNPTPTFAFVRFTGVVNPGTWRYCKPGNCEDWNDVWWKVRQCTGDLCEYRSVSTGAPDDVQIGCPEGQLELKQDFPAGCNGVSPVLPETEIVDLNGWRLRFQFVHTGSALEALVLIFPLFGPDSFPWRNAEAITVTHYRGELDREQPPPGFTADCTDIDPQTLTQQQAGVGPCDFSGATCEVRTTPP